MLSLTRGGWLVLILVLPLASCDRGGAGKPTIGVAFETLQTPGWVYAFGVLKDEIARRGFNRIEAIANGDSNVQLEQVRTFIAQRVDGIIIAPKDAKAVIPMIKAANQAGIPIVLYNRPAQSTDAKYVGVVADNVGLTRATVRYMAEQARKTGRKHKAACLIGDLADLNAIGRRDGFEQEAAQHADIIEVVARVPTEWNAEKARSGLTNALQADPDISFLFTSSDFMLPTIELALKDAGKWQKIGEPGHVILGAFDGDEKAYQLLVDGYLDADGVQDLHFESVEAVKAVADLRAGKPVPDLIPDPGFVIHQGNLKELGPRMWGSSVKPAR